MSRLLTYSYEILLVAAMPFHSRTRFVHLFIDFVVRAVDSVPLPQVNKWNDETGKKKCAASIDAVANENLIKIDPN